MIGENIGDCLLKTPNCFKNSDTSKPLNSVKVCPKEGKKKTKEKKWGGEKGGGEKKGREETGEKKEKGFGRRR